MVQIVASEAENLPEAPASAPTCTHNGKKAPCWYCSLPAFMFDEDGRIKPKYRPWASPWGAPRFWLGEGRAPDDE